MVGMQRLVLWWEMCRKYFQIKLNQYTDVATHKNSDGLPSEFLAAVPASSPGGKASPTVYRLLPTVYSKNQRS